MAPAIEVANHITTDATPIPCLHSCDGKCLKSKQLCDNQYDCTDRSDEPDICRKEYVLQLSVTDYMILVDTNECAIRNGGCSHICKDMVIGHECQCPAGYAIKGNSTCHGEKLVTLQEALCITIICYVKYHQMMTRSLKSNTNLHMLTIMKTQS